MIVARVVPCLDVTGGRVVKGTNFVDLRDAGDPVALVDARMLVEVELVAHRPGFGSAAGAAVP